MRQAVSALVASMVLVALGSAFGGIIYVGYNETNYSNMSCDIQSVQVFKLATNKHWISMQALNNGNYDISDYSIILYQGNSQIELVAKTGQNVVPGGKILEEFNTTTPINEQNIVLGLLIGNLENTANCIKEVEVWIK